MTGLLRLERQGPVAILVIDNPTMRNALTATMWQQFAHILDEVEKNPGAKVLVVRGEGEHFSAGADISSVQEILLDPSTGRHDGGDVTLAEQALARFSKPSIAAIDGYCVGGGWQIAGACDIRVACETASFGITPAKIGIVYPLSGIQKTVQLLGPSVAKYLLFTGDMVSATQARDWGLVSNLLPREDFWVEVQRFAEHLAGRSQFSVQAQKDLIDCIAQGGSARELAAKNAHWQREMSISEDPRIGVEAFLAKKTPKFTWVGPEND